MGLDTWKRNVGQPPPELEARLHITCFVSFDSTYMMCQKLQYDITFFFAFFFNIWATRSPTPFEL